MRYSLDRPRLKSIIQDRISSVMAKIGPLVGRFLVTEVQRNFADSGRVPVGTFDGIGQPVPPGRWVPVGSEVIRRRGPNAKPLVDTGRMMASISYRVEGNEILIGTNVKADNGYLYPLAHQYGTPTIPARPFLTVTIQAEADIREMILRQLTERR